MIYEAIILGMWVLTGLVWHKGFCEAENNTQLTWMFIFLVATILVSIFLRYPEVAPVVALPSKIMF